MSKKRIKWIDSLKGFAIITVVIGHVADGYLSSGMFSDYQGLMSKIYELIYAFHMPLFFLVSGYVFYQAYYRDGKEDKKRCNMQILNIAILYTLFSVILWAFKFVLSSNVNTSVSVKDLLLIVIKPIAPFWYLYVLIFFYIAAKFLLRKETGVIIPFIIFAGVSVFGFWMPRVIMFPLYQIFYYALFFFTGIFLVKYKDCFLSKAWFAGATTLVAVVLMVILWNNETMFHVTFAANTFIALGLCMGLVYVFSKIKVLENFALFAVCGKYCLEIYVIHCFLTAGNRVILPKLGIENFVLAFVVNSVVSTVIPIVIAIVCKKLKIHDLIFRPVKFFTTKKSK